MMAAAAKKLNADKSKHGEALVKKEVIDGIYDAFNDDFEKNLGPDYP